MSGNDERGTGRRRGRPAKNPRKPSDFRTRQDLSDRKARPHPWEEMEPDSIKLVSLSSDSSDSSPEVEPGTAQPQTRDDPSAGESGSHSSSNSHHDQRTNSQALMSCLMDCNLEEYKKLANTDDVDGILVPVQDTKHKVNYVTVSDLRWSDPYPGIQVCGVINSGPLKSGYLRISPRTVKPLEVSRKFMCFSVLDGKITAKSSSFQFNSDGVPCLESSTLECGSYIKIQPGGVYALENWTDEEVSLHFTEYTAANI